MFNRAWVRAVFPAFIVVLWFIGAGLGGPTFGKLDEVSSNDRASFLPASAESTKAGELQKAFTESTAVPAVIVVESEAEIPPQELGGYGTRGPVGGGVGARTDR